MPIFQTKENKLSAQRDLRLNNKMSSRKDSYKKERMSLEIMRVRQAPILAVWSIIGRLFIIIDYLVESFQPGSVDKFLHGEQKLLLGH